MNWSACASEEARRVDVKATHVTESDGEFLGLQSDDH